MWLGTHGTQKVRTGLISILLVALSPLSLRSDLDPNHSEPFPYGGYGVVIMGTWTDPYNEFIEQGLREAYLAFTENLDMDPNNVWVLVGNGADDWTEGLFDALPATQDAIRGTFQTVGDRMWDDPDTPRSLVVAIVGHGGGSSIALWGPGVTHADFVANYLNKINNNSHNSSPIERLDVFSTICYSGGIIDDFRDNFHNLRGHAWPNARHISTLTGCDYDEMSSALFVVPLLTGLRGDGQDVPDLDGDGVLSIYEYFDHSAKEDMTNPPDPYTPGVPDTIYVKGESYFGLFIEHPLYYEWNGAMLNLSINDEAHGHVELTPEPNHPGHLQYAVGTSVTLEAFPEPNMAFLCWKSEDPNHPGDLDHVTFDANNPTSVVLDADLYLTACFDDPAEPVFQCGGSTGSVLPMMLAALGYLMPGRLRLLRRRRA